MDRSPFKEVLVTSDSQGTAHNFCVWDPLAGTIMSTFREGNSNPRTLDRIGQDYILCALKDKPVIKMWTWCKTDRVELKVVVPGVVTALAISPRGHHCVAAINKKLHVWEISTGELAAVIPFHHQDVTCIKFTDDGWYFISIGKDTLVLVWHLVDVLNRCTGSVLNRPKPLYSWSDHTIEVTDVHVGHGGLKGKIATVSMDQTCRVYALSTGKLVFSIYVDVPLRSVVMDPAEYYLSIGANSGSIFQVEWCSCLNEESLSLTEDLSENIFVGHTGPVTCLSASLDGKFLVSGSDDESVKIWNVINRLCTITLKHSSPITNAFFTMAPITLLNSERFSPSIAVKQFKRGPSADRFLVPVEVKLHSQSLSTCEFEVCDDDFNKITAKGLSYVSTESRSELNSNLETVQGTNRQLYSFTMNSFLSVIKDHETYE